MKHDLKMPLMMVCLLTLVGCHGETNVYSASEKESSEEVASSNTEIPAVSSKEEEKTSTSSSAAEEPLKETEVIMVGDSTMTSFNDTTYYYPRYGYGTQIQNYLDTKAKVNNLSLSGRSSYSFLQEENYQTMVSSLDAGDYLVIGFGHNDEKSDDATRFRKADSDINTALSDTDSFQYCLYQNYIKVALDKGAYPILATPIVRANKNDDYSSDSGHITANGDYRKAIVDLATKYSLPLIDLTSITKKQYTTLGYETAKKYHAVTKGLLGEDGVTVTPDFNTVDNTHLNIYGAKYVAYSFAEELKNTSSTLAKYVLSTAVAPTETDLVKNPNYVYTAYESVDWSAYAPLDQFTTTSEGFYGTAFGDTGGDPASSSNANGYYAKEETKGTFKVGQYLESGSKKGKVTSSGMGFAFLFRQISVKKDFTMTASAKVLQSGATKQSGFGLMIRDDCYLPAKDVGKTSNLIAAGFDLADPANTSHINFKFENGKKSDMDTTLDAYYAIDDTASFTITRVGQTIRATTVYQGKTTTDTFTDFDLVAVDSDYYYVGMWATRGTLVEFSSVTYQITGDSQQA